MPLTVDACCNELVARAEELMGLCGLSVVRDSTNPDAVMALGYGYRALGHVPAGGLVPVDGDMALVTDAETNSLLDLAEYRVLATCRNRWTEVRMQVGAGSAYWSDLRDSLDRRLGQLWSQLKASGMIGLAPLTGGVIVLDIVETDATETQLIDYPGSS